MPAASDLGLPLQTALLAAIGITTLLPAYLGSFPVFLRRPVPTKAPYPMIVISPDVSQRDSDSLNGSRVMLVRDIVTYGQNNTPGQYVAIENIARLVSDLFHRQKDAISVANWHVTDITCMGPIPAPTDNDNTVARLVEVTVRLDAKVR